MNDFIEKNYKQMLINSKLKDEMYYYKMNNVNINSQNFVKSGSLVFRIIRVLNFNIDAKKRSVNLNELDNYINNIEKEVIDLLGISVRFLYYDIIIPPNSKIDILN